MDNNPARKKNWDLTQESFDQLLSWLHEDREQAGERYEQIRAGLIRGFKSHGCLNAEELADETINRVAKKLPELIATYVGNPVRYFYGVGHKVHLESLRHEQGHVPLPSRELSMVAQDDEIELVYECLEQCLQHIPEQSRQLILEFYQGEKATKIKSRKELARRLNLKLGNLRLQAHRIRGNLSKCIRDCLSQKALA